jgi:protein arginine N-methyltransferase 1
MDDINDYFNLTVNGQHIQVSRVCPHRAGRLDHGHVNYSRQTITCPLHNSIFCLKSGEQLAGPKSGSIDILPADLLLNN